MFFITTGQNIHLALVELLTVFEGKVEIINFEHKVIVFNIEVENIELKIAQMWSVVKFGIIFNSTVLERDIKEDLLLEIKNNYQDKKLNFALNYFSCPDLNLSFPLKNALKEQGLKVRLVKGKQKILNGAEIKFNRLTEKGKGIDINVFNINSKYYLGQTNFLQDFEGFSYRDYKRPFRDTFNGLLPPKLARIMINLSGFKTGETVYDPFCGDGTVLMETILLWGKAVGSDTKKEKIESTRKNLEFLDLTNFKLFENNVLNLEKIRKDFWPQIDKIVFEWFLGKPKKEIKHIEQVKKETAELTDFYEKFFMKLSRLISPKTVIVAALPIVFYKDMQISLIPNLRPKLKLFNYQIKKVQSFIEKNLQTTKNDIQCRGLNLDSLIYRREKQTVGREIIILTVKSA